MRAVGGSNDDAQIGRSILMEIRQKRLDGYDPNPLVWVELYLEGWKLKYGWISAAKGMKKVTVDFQYTFRGIVSPCASLFCNVLLRDGSVAPMSVASLFLCRYVTPFQNRETIFFTIYTDGTQPSSDRCESALTAIENFSSQKVTRNYDSVGKWRE